MEGAEPPLFDPTHHCLGFLQDLLSNVRFGTVVMHTDVSRAHQPIDTIYECLFTPNPRLLK